MSEARRGRPSQRPSGPSRRFSLEIIVVEGCAYGCDPTDHSALCDQCKERLADGDLPHTTIRPRVVDLPVSATEDRVVGTLDFEAALREGTRAFHPGLLAEANRSILYVDEVNLLDDHLVDTLLDAAAMGVNVVEREGVSVSHPARFILVGTMNPEEGELRPQLLDRFGLCVDVSALHDTEQRVEVMRRRRLYEEDPVRFRGEWDDAESDLRARIQRACEMVDDVETADEILYVIADLSLRAGVDGHRPDTVMARAATAFAALEGRSRTSLADVEHVAPMVLAHRLRRTPLDRVGVDAQTLRAVLAQALGDSSEATVEVSAEQTSVAGSGQTSMFEAIQTASELPKDVTTDAEYAPNLSADMDSTRRDLGGRRQLSVATTGRGRYTRSERPRINAAPTDIAFDATVRAAVQDATPAGERGGPAVRIDSDHIRTKVRTRKVGATIVFCVDASGSMGASSRIGAAKGAILSLLDDAYQRRDRVALVTFRGQEAQLVLSPTASVGLAGLKLNDLPTGGSTPMAAGIEMAIETLRSERKRQPDSVGWVVLVTDGHANVGLNGGSGSADAVAQAQRIAAEGFNALVIDTAKKSGAHSAALELATASGGEYVRIGSVSGAAIENEIRQRV